MRARILSLFLLACMVTAIPVKNGLAQGEITNLSADYQFGKIILFSADLYTTQPLQYALIYFQVEKDLRTVVEPVQVTTQDNRNYQLSYSMDLEEAPLRAFAKISYYFEVTLQSGEIITSQIEELRYLDDRFNWQSKEDAPFQVFWHSGDVLFAQTILDVARAGYARIKTLLPVTNITPIEIYVYPNAQEMQETMQLAGRSWAAGHADPDLGVIAVSLPPGPEQQLLTEQRIPHELMHILLYQKLGEGYLNLPTWLNEGLPSLAELYPNPDYQTILDSAYQKEGLMPISTLCQGFPQEASGALLAYAQSASFTAFLHNTYGADQLQALANEYAGGVDCEIGVQNVYGKSITQLEQNWRQERFDENVTWDAMIRLLPWLILLVAVLAAPLTLTVIWLRRRPARL